MKTKNWRLRSNTAEIQVREMPLAPGTLNEEARTVDAVLVSEAPVNMGRFDEVLVMEGLRELPKQIPLLDSHARNEIDRVMGSVRNIRREGTDIVGTLHFSDTERGRNAFALARDGHVTDVSGGMIYTEIAEVKRGESRDVMGRKWEPKDRDLRLVTAWELKETSVVAIGADQTAKLRGSADGQQESDDMNKKLREYLVKLGMRLACTDPEAWAFYNALDGAKREVAEALHAERDVAEEVMQRALGVTVKTEPADAPKVEPKTEERAVVDPADAIAAERARCKAIREIAAGVDLDQRAIDKAIDDGVTPEQFKDVALKHVRESRSLNIHVPQQFSDVSDREVLASAICLRGGIQPKGVTEEQINRADQYRGRSILDIAERTLAMEGKTFSNREELVQRAVTTGSFTNLLANVTSKSLGTAFEEAKSTAQEWCGKISLNDFRPHKHTRLGNDEGLSQLAPGGEFPHTSPSDVGEDMSLKTFGSQTVFTREQMINDDLGALTTLPMKKAMAAVRLIDDKVYAELQASAGGPTVEGSAMFQVAGGRANYYVNAAAPLGVASLAKTKELMRKIKGLANEYLNIMPRYLIVPPELEHTALVLVNSSEVVIAGDTDTVRGNRNAHAGSLKVIVEPRLSENPLAWYIAGDFAQEEHMAIGYLRGMETPTLREVPVHNTLGWGYQVYFDVVAKAVGWRSMVKSKGSA